MDKRRNYRQLESTMTTVLLASVAVFILYLIFAILGIVWLKVIMAIVAIAASILSLVMLYMNQELLKSRSLWMTTGFFGVFLCTVVSLLATCP